MQGAIEALPEDERGALDLVRIHVKTYAKAAEMLDVSAKTVQRRLNRVHLILTGAVGDLQPGSSHESETLPLAGRSGPASMMPLARD